MEILIIQTAFIGDCLLSLPFITAVNSYYPNSKITVLTADRGKQIFESHPNVDSVITYSKTNQLELIQIIKEIRSKKFDVLFSLHKSVRTSIISTFSNIRQKIGFKNAKFSSCYTTRVDIEKIIKNSESLKKLPYVHAVVKNLLLVNSELTLAEAEKYDFNLTAPAITEYSTKLREKLLNLSKYIVCVPGSVWKTKQLDTAVYNQVINELLKNGHTVVVAGAPNEKEIANKVLEGIDSENNNLINITGESSLKEMFTLIKNSELVLCNDSMTLHIASAFKKKTVAFFCATILDFGFGPWNNRNSIVIQKEELWCRPCGKHGGQYCPTGSNLCRTNFNIVDIISKIETLLKK